MKAELDGFRTWRHIVRAAEGGQEIVQSSLVGQVDDRKAKTPLVAIIIEQVVVAYRNVEQIARLNTRRVLVIIFSARRRNMDKC